MTSSPTPSVPIDPTVVEALTRGDPDAIVEVYRAMAPAVRSYLLRQTRDATWADDLTAEVFLEVMRSVERFSGTPEGLRAWVFRIARNRVVDHFRRESHRRHDPLDRMPEGAEPAELHVDPESVAVSNVERERLLAIVDELPADQRDVIMLRVIGDLPIAEVASILGKSAGAVKSLQHRALRSLARRIGRELEGA